MIRTLITSLLATGLLSATATADVNGPGPSDPNLFDMVINIPADQIFINGNVGNSNGEPMPTTQLNVSDGGNVGNHFDAFSGSEVNIRGGAVGSNFRANTGSEVNIIGGDVGSINGHADSVVNISGGSTSAFYANFGAEVNISGGIINSRSDANSGSIVNISGGRLRRDFRAHSGSVVNISGGSVDTLGAYSGSEVNISGGNIGSGSGAAPGGVMNISGGSVGTNFRVNPDSEVNISGGSFGSNFDANPGNDLELIGGEFMLNGVEYTESTITLNYADVFSGTFADGSSFIFSRLAWDELSGVTLTMAPLPPLDTTPRVVNNDMTAIGPSGLRAGQHLTLRPGGILGDSFAVVGATLNVEGGEIGRGLEVAGAVVNISSGTVDDLFLAYSDSVLNISGGRVDGLYTYSGSVTNMRGGSVGRFHSNSGSLVNISGGRVRSFRAGFDSVVNISGGTLGHNFQTSRGSKVSISGGTVGHSFYGGVGFGGGGSFLPDIGGDVEFIGGEFMLNGVAYTESTITLTGNDVFTGTLADGSSFIFTPLAGDTLNSETLTTVPLPPLVTMPQVVSTDISETGPYGLRAGQDLTLLPGGVLSENFAVVDATLNIVGGEVGNGLEAAGSVVNISGGTVSFFVSAQSGSEVNIRGGNVSALFYAMPDSVVNMSGGIVGSGFQASTDSEINIAGGTLGEGFRALGGSEVNLFGTEFLLDDERLDALILGDPLTISNRSGQTLSGTLADGSTFSFALNDSDNFSDDFFAVDALLTVTLVPEPNSALFLLLGCSGLFARWRFDSPAQE